ncbi:hypothetical protein N431DRAFT_185809 [Stipitochalara longipes BDJ]|nr:hypothetical protein N431DRAFT_185809 [Stipitochalara longipes BDJ]
MSCHVTATRDAAEEHRILLQRSCVDVDVDVTRQHRASDLIWFGYGDPELQPRAAGYSTETRIQDAHAATCCFFPCPSPWVSEIQKRKDSEMRGHLSGALKWKGCVSCRRGRRSVVEKLGTIPVFRQRLNYSPMHEGWAGDRMPCHAPCQLSLHG